MQPILAADSWRSSTGQASFRAENPQDGGQWPDEFPVSPWQELDGLLDAAVSAAEAVADWPGERFADFLDRYATEIERDADALVTAATEETALPVEPRLKAVELPRTTSQLRQAAQAARTGEWAMPTIDVAANIRSMYRPLGPVVIFGPNNFPFAFNSVSGGDFAAAVAAGNPVIAKAHPGHPRTTRLLAEELLRALQQSSLPSGFVQMFYAAEPADGLKLVSDSRVGATAFTGGRHSGLQLKAAADQAGKPIYLEMSSLNPLVLLPGALRERGGALVDEYVTSVLMGTGQFCTNPGLVFLLRGAEADSFIQQVAERFRSAAPGLLLNGGVKRSLELAVATLKQSGAKMLAGDVTPTAAGIRHPNTLFRTAAAQFLKQSGLQTEAFGNCALCVVAENEAELIAALQSLEGQLTGSIYSAHDGADDALAGRVAGVLQRKVGRLMNDKMPTGVAVSAAMNHGGPYPATGHPGFTAVGIPASLRRFAMLQCYDNVRENRLPLLLRNRNPESRCWRRVDGEWTKADATPS